MAVRDKSKLAPVKGLNPEWASVRAHRSTVVRAHRSTVVRAHRSTVVRAHRSTVRT